MLEANAKMGIPGTSPDRVKSVDRGVDGAREEKELTTELQSLFEQEFLTHESRESLEQILEYIFETSGWYSEIND